MRIRWCLLLSASLALISCSALSRRAQVAHKVPFQVVQNLILLSVFAENHPLYFILDTGAGNTVISDKAASKLGLDLARLKTAEGASATTSFKVYLGAISNVRIGTLHVPDMAVAVMPMQFLAQKIDREVDGVLGKNFLENYLTTIDYRHKRITFLPFMPALASDATTERRPEHSSSAKF